MNKRNPPRKYRENSPFSPDSCETNNHTPSLACYNKETNYKGIGTSMIFPAYLSFTFSLQARRDLLIGNSARFLRRLHTEHDIRQQLLLHVIGRLHDIKKLLRKDDMATSAAAASTANS